MIKMVMALERGVLPRTLHAGSPSGQVDWSDGSVALLQREMVWPEVGRPRRAGVSSFGISGTNAHVIVEQAPVQEVLVLPVVAGGGSGSVAVPVREALVRPVSADGGSGLVAAAVQESLVQRVTADSSPVVAADGDVVPVHQVSVQETAVLPVVADGGSAAVQESLALPVVADGGSGSVAVPVQGVLAQPVAADGDVALVQQALVQESKALPLSADVDSGLVAAPVQEPVVQRVTADGGSTPVSVPVPWVVSGRSVSGLGAQAARLAGWVKERSGVDVTAVGRSLVSRRALLEHRVVVWGRDAAELGAGLERLAEQQGLDAGAVGGGGVGVRGSVRCAVLFTGQGAQRWGMGRQLYGAFPVFAAALDEVCQLFDAVVSFSVRDAVLGRGEVFDVADTGVGQPVLFAFEVALFRLWCSWGVGVEAVAGHSLGGVTAAWAAGVLSLSDAVALVAARGRLMGALPSGGAMLAVGASEDEIAQVLV
ncbi:MAG: acyltransferase domain-containing protein, partial [Streptomyces sp.]|nr:acyltransferase domain-containing protein [Streptomyces sp.]